MRVALIGTGKMGGAMALATKELFARAAQSVGDLDLSAIALPYEKQPAR